MLSPRAMAARDRAYLASELERVHSGGTGALLAANNLVNYASRSATPEGTYARRVAVEIVTRTLTGVSVRWSSDPTVPAQPLRK